MKQESGLGRLQRVALLESEREVSLGPDRQGLRKGEVAEAGLVQP